MTTLISRCPSLVRKFATLAIIFTPALTAAQTNRVADPFEKGSTVQLQGCGVEGERPGTFVFSRVTAWPVAPINGEFGPRFFWLSQVADRLGEHLGQTIQVTGTVFEVRESEIERNPGYHSRNGRRVAIELPVGDVFTSPELAGIGKADRDSRVDQKVTMIGVQVESMLVVMPKCLPTWR